MIERIKGWVCSYYDKFIYSYLLLRLIYFIKPYRSIPVDSTISVAIPHYNNSKLIHYALSTLIRHPGIEEIVVLDDGSVDKEFSLLTSKLKPFKRRVKLYRRPINYGAFATKIEVVSLCNQDWVLLLDCDNTYPSRSIDKLISINKSFDTIYCSSFAFPHFNFESLKGKRIDFKWMSEWVFSKHYNGAFLNDGNYLVPRINFLRVTKPYFKKKLKVSEVAFMNYLWLLSNFHLEVIDTRYLHRIHKFSISFKYVDDGNKNSRLIKSLYLSNSIDSIPNSKRKINFQLIEEVI